MPRSVDIRRAMEDRWNKRLSKHKNLFASDALSGSSPPSVFVGSYGYPRVNVGPMVPPIHGDTSLLDSPERWAGRSLDEIVDYRLSLVRGIQSIRADDPHGRYVQSLQDVAMSSRPADSEIEFERPATPMTSLDGHSAPSGSVGRVRSARFSGPSSERRIERVYYDEDLGADDAVLRLYNDGIEISRIQKCLSMGMLGRKRRLVPTRWSITATDDMISQSLIDQVLDAPVTDSHRVFYFAHMGNLFSVILFPHRWLYEMTEAWYSDGVLGFGSDHEDARGMKHPPAIAGAYFAAKLAVAEYLTRNKIQAGVLILREIRPEYAMPVGVWQVREGVREAMKQKPIVTDSFEHSLDVACMPMSISKHEWLSKGVILRLIKQRTLSDFF